VIKVYNFSNFIQKHFIGGYELYTKHKLRAKNNRPSETSEINELDSEESNEEIDATIVDQENGILFNVKLKELQDGELPTEKALKESSIFELKSDDGKTKKFLISTAVAKLLKEQTKIEGDLYMMDRDESAEFDANVASSSDCYKPSTYLSLLTGEKSYAVAAGKDDPNDTLSKAGTGSKRTAAAKFIDPLAELIKPGVKQYGDDRHDQFALKGTLSKSRVMVAFLIASVLIMGAVLFLTFGGAPILGIGIIATIPLYLALPVAIGPFGLAVVLNIFSTPYVEELNEDDAIEKTLTKRHKVYNFIAHPANKAVLVYSAVSVLIALVAMPFFGPLTFAVASFSVLMLILGRIGAAKGRSLAAGTFMFFAVTPWLMGAVRYLITSGILLKPLAAGLAWIYERITNWNFHTNMNKPSQYLAIFLYFIGSFIVGLLSGVAGVFGIKIPLSRVNFDQAKYGKDARDICHWIAVHIAANVGRIFVLSLVISTVVMTIAYTSGIAALISGLGFISSIPVVGSIMSWLFISGPMSFFLSSTVSVVSVVLGGAGFSIFLAYPILREVWILLKELTTLKPSVAISALVISIAMLSIIPGVGIPMLCITGFYLIFTIGKFLNKHYSIDHSPEENYLLEVEEIRNEQNLEEINPKFRLSYKIDSVLKRSGVARFPKSIFGTFFVEIWDAIKGLINKLSGRRANFEVRWSDKTIDVWFKNREYFENEERLFDFVEKVGLVPSNHSNNQELVEKDPDEKHLNMGDFEVLDDSNVGKFNIEEISAELTHIFEGPKIAITEEELISLAAGRVQVIEAGLNRVIMYCDAYGTASGTLLPIINSIFPGIPVVGIQGVRIDRQLNTDNKGFCDHAEVVFTLPEDDNIYLVEPKAKNTLKPDLPVGKESNLKIIELGLQNRFGSMACVTFSSAIADLLKQYLLSNPDASAGEVQNMLSELYRYDLLRYMETKNQRIATHNLG
jgi:hypothetical protein